MQSSQFVSQLVRQIWTTQYFFHCTICWLATSGPSHFSRRKHYTNKWTLPRAQKWHYMRDPLYWIECRKKKQNERRRKCSATFSFDVRQQKKFNDSIENALDWAFKCIAHRERDGDTAPLTTTTTAAAVRKHGAIDAESLGTVGAVVRTRTQRLYRIYDLNGVIYLWGASTKMSHMPTIKC